MTFESSLKDKENSKRIMLAGSLFNNPIQTNRIHARAGFTKQRKTNILAVNQLHKTFIKKRLFLNSVILPKN